jgi:GntR family transcriptional regulator
MPAATSSSVGIDRSSEVPYYVQLSRLLESEIDAGVYKPGDRLPGESELCVEYNLARSTVRETLRSLVDQGKIKLVPRRGAFVVDRQDSGWRLQVTQGFFEVEVDQHHSVETRVLEATRCVLPDFAAAGLEATAGSPGFKIARVRRLDGKLALYSVNYLLPAIEDVLRSSDVISGRGSLNHALQSAGYETFRARRSVDALPADKNVSTLLDVPLGHPLLLVTSVSWDRMNKPFDFYTSWLRSDVVRVTVEAQAG